MKEMIQARKEQLQKRGKKGFTLMEMLIVVAIIAVLIAIAIPTFLAQLDKARAETDTANVRSGYASAVATVMMNNVTSTTHYILQKDGSVKNVKDTDATTNAYACQGASKNADQSEMIGGVTTITDSTWNVGNNIYYHYVVTDGSGAWSISNSAS